MASSPEVAPEKMAIPATRAPCSELRNEQTFEVYRFAVTNIKTEVFVTGQVFAQRR